ncbi:MAG TPA: hypothetical protein VHV57_17375 [Acidimicrobiales bacterium]|nr:hypothetical protein [Acidimicrobiales bacterium]
MPSRLWSAPRPAGLGAAAAMALLIPVAGLLHDVPLVALSAVLIYIAVRIFPVGELAAIFRFDEWELSLSTSPMPFNSVSSWRRHWFEAPTVPAFSSSTRWGCTSWTTPAHVS